MFQAGFYDTGRYFREVWDRKIESIVEVQKYRLQGKRILILGKYIAVIKTIEKVVTTGKARS